jgi:osmotically-inducible protein OsmY
MSTMPLSHEVFNAVVHNPHLKRRQVHFKTEDGKVTLGGSVKSYFEKQMAQEALRNIDGVEQIENNLEVHWS